ncbi:FxSxx-COOH system tetratricopeptide repeat protein [Streptomyces phaeochromogenes]
MADAVYLAACQDAAVPYRNDPPRPGRRKTEAQPSPVPPEASPPRPPAGTPHGRPAQARKDHKDVPEDPRSALGARPDSRGPRPVVDLVLDQVTPSAVEGRLDRPGPSGPPEPLELARALRPLRLSVSSPYQLELDEEATAERSAADRLWTPVCRPTPERLLDAVLLVEESASMAVWRPTADRVRALLEQTAAFGTVRVARWYPDDASARVRPASIARSAGRQLLMVLTDGGSAAWRTGTATEALYRLGRSSPVVVLNVLPQHLWHLTLPSVTRTQLRASAPAAPNRCYEVGERVSTADFLGPEPRENQGARVDPTDGLPVPVVELRPASLRRWANLVASADGRTWHRMAALPTAPVVEPPTERVDGSELRLEDLLTEPTYSGTASAMPTDPAAAVVRRFRAVASPTAYTLAQRLAAVPLNLPVMRLVQRNTPDTDVWNLAEVILLGLVRRTDEAVDIEDEYRVSYDFAAGVREELLALGSRAGTVRALRQVQQHLGPRLEAMWEGAAALVSPDADLANPPLNEQTRPFAAHLYTALCALSGPYLARADRLGQLLQDSAHQARPVRVAGTKQSERYSHRDSASKFTSDTGDGDMAHDSHRQQTPPAKTSSHVGGLPLPSRRPTPAPPRTTSAVPSRQGGNAVSAGLPVAPAPRGPNDPPRIFGNVPQRNRNFTGRKQLLELLEVRLTSGLTAVLPEALHGMGGVGKSQIATEYVYRRSRAYRLIWWIPSEQENQIVQSLIELGEHMGLQAGLDISAVPAVLNALRIGEPYSDWLLVFDNAEDPRDVRRYFPVDGPGRILVTSRNAQWASTASSLEVDVFAREESIALLRRRSDDLPDDAVNHLASVLGDLPLAVEQAAVWLAETGMPVNQYLELFEQKSAELMQSDPPADYAKPVAAAWNVSLDRLREDHPAALQLLQVGAFFAPDPVSWDLFSAVRGVSVPSALQAVLDDPVKLGRATREISRYALARIDHRQNTLQLHRLVQRVLIDQMNPQEKAQMRHAAHQLLSNADPRNPQRTSNWPRYSALLPHVRASNAVECKDPWTRRLVLNEVWFLRARGDHTEALALGERAARVWRERLDEDHEEVLAIDQQIAEALREQGSDYERAYRLQEGLVGRFRRVLGNSHEDTLQAQSYMAIHHRIRGDFYQARELDKDVYETTIRELGQDDPATLLSAHNYAVSLRLAGDFDAARTLDHDTWQRRIEVIGEDHIFTLGTYDAYLLDLQELGRYEEALEGFEQLTATVREQLGEEHSFTIRVIRNLAVTLRKKGNHQAAYDLTARYLPIVKERVGEEHRDFLRLALSHANDLRQTGRLQEAWELGTRVMETHRGKFGRQHPHSYATSMNVAVTLRLLGEVETARALNEEAVKGLTNTLGSDHPRTLLARMNLASDYFALGQADRAYEIDSVVAEASVARRGPDHPANLVPVLNLSYDLKSLGRTEEGQETYGRALATYRRILGAAHPATRDAEEGVRANVDFDQILL